METVMRNDISYSACNSIMFFDNWLPAKYAGITLKKFGSCLFKNRNNKYEKRMKKLMHLTGANNYFAPIPEHSDKFVEITETNRVRNVLPCDCFVFEKNGAESSPLMMFSTGDCPVIFLGDGNVFSLIHSGIYGTAKNICGKMLINLSGIYGLNSENTKAIIWPGISKQFYEVGKEWENIFPGEIDEKGRINLSLLILKQLLQGGLKNHQISTLNIFCSAEQENNFFSFRNRKEKGRNLTFIKP